MDIEKSLREYINFSQRITEEKFGHYPRIDFEETLSIVENNCSELIDKYLDEYFALLDVGVQLMIEILEIIKNEEEIPFVYQALFSKKCGQLFAMRKLLKAGFMDPYKCLVRSFQEGMDILFACLGNEEFASTFGKTDVMYDNNEFWRKEISKGKIKSKIIQLFNRLNVDEKYIEYYFSRRKDAQRFLSESIHSSFNSLFATVTMSTIDGGYSNNIYGKITTAYPNALFCLLEDINLINQVIFMSFNKNIGQGFYNKNFIGEQYFKYHHFFIMYDTAYSMYHMKLNDYGECIFNTMNETLETKIK